MRSNIKLYREIGIPAKSTPALVVSRVNSHERARTKRNSLLIRYLSVALLLILLAAGVIYLLLRRSNSKKDGLRFNNDQSTAPPAANQDSSNHPSEGVGDGKGPDEGGDEQTRRELEKEREKREAEEAKKVAFESFLPYPGYSIFSLLYVLCSKTKGASVDKMTVVDPTPFLSQSVLSIQQVLASMSRSIHPSITNAPVIDGSIEDSSYYVRRVISDVIGINGDSELLMEGYSKVADPVGGACFKTREALLEYCKTGVRRERPASDEPGVFPSPVNQAVLRYNVVADVSELSSVPATQDSRYKSNGSDFAIGRIRVSVPDDEALIRSVITKKSKEDDEASLKDWLAFLSEPDVREKFIQLVKTFFICASLPISSLATARLDTTVPSDSRLSQEISPDSVLLFTSDVIAHRSDLSQSSGIIKSLGVNDRLISAAACSVSADTVDRIAKWLYILAGYSLNQFRLDTFMSERDKSRVLPIDLSQALNLVSSSDRLSGSYPIGFIASLISKGLFFLSSEFAAIDERRVLPLQVAETSGFFCERGNEAVMFAANKHGLSDAIKYRSNFLTVLRYRMGAGCSYSRNAYQDVINQYTLYKDKERLGTLTDEDPFPSPYTLLANNEPIVMKSIREFCAKKSAEMRELGYRNVSRSDSIEKVLILALSWFSIPVNDLSYGFTRFYPSSEIISLLLAVPNDKVVEDMKQVGLDPNPSYPLWSADAPIIDRKYKQLLFSAERIDIYFEELVRQAALNSLVV